MAILAITAFTIRQFFDVNDYKSRIEAGVANSTGMRLSINGNISLRVFPRVRIGVKDVHLANRGSELFAASEIQVAPRVIPYLLHREVVVDKVFLREPKLMIEKDAHGRMNYETARTNESKAPQRPTGTQKESGPGQVHAVSIENGRIEYLDRKAGKKTEINGMSLDLSGITRNANTGENRSKRGLMGAVSFKGKFSAQSVRSDSLVASNVKAEVRDDRGLIHLDSTEANVYGGALRGSAQINLRGDTPVMKVAQTASHVDLKEALPNGKGRATGFVDAAVDLTATGTSAASLTKSANGRASVKGDDITVAGVNLDELAGQLKSAQGMGLVSIGTALVTGPLAPALGQAAGISGGDPNAKTVIRHLVSEWEIVNGTADAKDVAIATSENTIAFKGKVDLVSKSYQDFFVATVDPNGCSKNKIEIVGDLNRPRPKVESIGKQVAQSYVGDAKSKLESEAKSKIGKLFGAKPEPEAEPNRQPAAEASAPGGTCDHFYTGAVVR